MEPIYLTEVTRVKDGKKFKEMDSVIKEVKIDIVINGEKTISLMAVPTDIKELCIGYIIGENIIQKVKDISKIEIENEDERNYEVYLDAKVDTNSLKKLSSEGVMVSGCGKAKSTLYSPKSIEASTITSNFSIEAKLLFEQMKRFYTQCPLYEKTGCVHTAKLYLDDKRYFIGEDIAQHNTIDKAVGKALMEGCDITNSFLMVSGRLSSEMVAKAIVHKIPLLASRTASTCRGVMIAKKFGLTLIGFVRGVSMNIYANPQRIVV